MPNKRSKWTRHRRQIGGGEIEDEVGYNEAATGSMQEDGLVYLRHATDDDVLGHVRPRLRGAGLQLMSEGGPTNHRIPGAQ